jgi:targeting protein for Xklp2
MKPFNLSHGKKRTFDEAAYTYVTYVPLAQWIKAFHKGKPGRYHLRSKKKDINLLPSTSVTKISRDPQIPVLQTKCLSRPVTCKSAAEQEVEEVEKISQYKFNAWGLDPRIIDCGPILLKKPPVKLPAQPVSFDLEIEERIQQ